MKTVEDLLDAGMALQNSGKQDEALDAYLEVLKVDPNHPDAMHLIGVIAFESGKTEAAADLIGAAVNRLESVPLYRENLAIVYRALGREEDAVQQERIAADLRSPQSR